MRVLILFLATIIAVAVSERNCTKPGIVRSSDPHKFVVCAEREGKLLATVNQCSEGLVFDFVRQRCTVPRIMSFLSVADEGTSTITNASSNIYTPTPQAPLPCKNAGAMCDTCSTLSFCVSTFAISGSNAASNNTVKIMTLTCEAGAVCVTWRGCVKKSSGGLCRQGKFRCGDVGTFPDLYDCTKYHTCYTDSTGQLVDEEGQCAGGIYGNRWSPENSQCGWSENVEECLTGYPVPMCNYELQMGAIGGQIYYICMVDKASHTLSPTLFRCPMDLVFDANKYSCVPNPPISTTMDYSTTTSVHTSTGIVTV